jgi:hypothetical protein
MSALDFIEEASELEDEAADSVDLEVSNKLFMTFPILSAAAGQPLTHDRFVEQLIAWEDGYAQIWKGRESEYIYDHLLRDLCHLGDTHRDTFIADTSILFRGLTVRAGEDARAALSNVWLERREHADTLLSVAKQARELCYGWLKGFNPVVRQQLGVPINDYFVAQNGYLTLRHYVAMQLHLLVTHWPTDHRVPAWTALQQDLRNIDGSITKSCRTTRTRSVLSKLRALN